ncbi:Uncharacterised protein [Mycobacteroides abscessus subsp. massiliense]|nr:Uncharacterised protein [Mycobacteroides abscessus subsp. massiliense]
MGASLPFHPLKSPITETPCALGAHTAKEIPLTSPSAVTNERGCAPRISQSRS